MKDADREAIEQAARKAIDADYHRIMKRLDELEGRIAEIERALDPAETNLRGVPIKVNKDRAL